MNNKDNESHVLRMKDIAMLVGVSTATVSRALKSPNLVAPTTRAKIQAIVQKTGYAPLQAARSLRTSRNFALLIAIPTIESAYYTTCVNGAQNFAQQAGYSVLLSDMQVSRSSATTILNSHQVDGVIGFSDIMPKINTDRPRVAIGPAMPKSACPSVGIDDQAAMRKATEFLIAHGHRRIAFIGGPSQSKVADKRLEGYRIALEAADVEYQKNLVASTYFGMEHGGRAVNEILAQNDRPTALVCTTDEQAIGALHAITYEQGLCVPDDISVIGFDDHPVARFLTPTLTTVRQSAYTTGQKAAEMLISQINGEELPCRRVTLPTNLVIRDSVKHIAG